VVEEVFSILSVLEQGKTTFTGCSDAVETLLKTFPLRFWALQNLMMKPYVFGLVPSLHHLGRLPLAWVFVRYPSARSPPCRPLHSRGVTNNYHCLNHGSLYGSIA